MKVLKILSRGLKHGPKGALIALGIFIVVGPAPAQELQSEFVMEIEIEAGDPHTVGDAPLGMRAIYPVSGGSFEGPQLKGKILDGADWLIVRGDGVYELDVRLTLQTDEGDIIYMSYDGYLRAEAQVMERILAGDDVPAGQYYMRTTPRFETASEELDWLNSTIFVGTGIMGDGKVNYRIYRID